MKKGLALVVALIMIAGGAAIADEVDSQDDVLTPADTTYKTGRLVEEAQHELSEDFVEIAGQQNEFAERRMAALQHDKGREHALSLLEEMEEHEERLSQALGALAENEEEDLEEEDLIEEISERVEEATRRRSERLAELAQDDTMPEQAREGARGAIENQERALIKVYQAMENARRGIDREDVDSEEYRQDAKERAREQLPEEARERFFDDPGSEGSSPEVEEGEEGAEQTPDPGNAENEGKDARGEVPGAEQREERQPGNAGENNRGQDR